MDSSTYSNNNSTFIYSDFETFTCDDIKYQIYNKNYSKNEYDDLNDMPFKYVNIINTLKKIQENNHVNFTTLVEPGCAYSSLSAYLTKLFNLSTVYLFDFANVSGKNIQEEQHQIFSNNKLNNTIIKFHPGDFFENISKIPDNSIDIVIDGCSITHFCGSKGGLESWNKFASGIYNKLSSNGYIVLSTDINNHHDIENAVGATEEFLYPQDIINIFLKYNYEIVFNPIISNNVITLGTMYSLRVLHICFRKKTL